MEDIFEIVDDINVNAGLLSADGAIDPKKIPQIAIKEHLDRYICVVDEWGSVAYYAKIPDTAKKNKIGGGIWMAIYQESLGWMAHQNLTGEQWKVFAAMCNMMSFDNYIRINQTALAKEFHTNQAHISRSIKRLLELNIFTEGPREGVNKTYILNPKIGIKGKQRKQKLVDYKKAKAAWENEKVKKSSTTDKTKE